MTQNAYALRLTQTKKAGADFVYLWLKGLDPHQDERAELSAARVPAHVIEELYQTGFNALIPGLTAHFAALNATPGGQSMGAKINSTPMVSHTLLFLNLTDDQRARCSATFNSQTDPALQALYNELMPRLATHPRPESAANVLVTYLLFAWWTLTHRGELALVPGLQAQTLACWCGKYLLELPELATWQAPPVDDL